MFSRHTGIPTTSSRLKPLGCTNRDILPRTLVGAREFHVCMSAVLYISIIYGFGARQMIPVVRAKVGDVTEVIVISLVFTTALLHTAWCHGVRPCVRAVAVVGHGAAGDGVAVGGEDAGVAVAAVAAVAVIIAIQAIAATAFGCHGERAAAAELQRAIGKDGQVRALAGDGVVFLRRSAVYGLVVVAFYAFATPRDVLTSGQSERLGAGAAAQHLLLL